MITVELLPTEHLRFYLSRLLFISKWIHSSSKIFIVINWNYFRYVLSTFYRDILKQIVYTASMFPVIVHFIFILNICVSFTNMRPWLWTVFSGIFREDFKRQIFFYEYKYGLCHTYQWWTRLFSLCNLQKTHVYALVCIRWIYINQIKITFDFRKCENISLFSICTLCYMLLMFNCVTVSMKFEQKWNP